MNKRTDAREVAVKLVFEYLFNSQINEQLVSDLAEEYELTTEQTYACKVYYGVVENMEALTNIIKEHAVGFSIDRIFKVDRAIMLVALYEIMFEPTIDYPVSVNEAIKLAKKYSTEKSSKFINGILAKIEKNGNYQA